MQQAFIAKLVFEVIDSKPSAARKFDEQWRVFHAVNQRELVAKIHDSAKTESESITRADGTEISWSFVACTEIVSLHQPNNTELISTMKFPKAANQYLAFIQAKNLLQ